MSDSKQRSNAEKAAEARRAMPQFAATVAAVLKVPKAEIEQDERARLKRPSPNRHKAR